MHLGPALWPWNEKWKREFGMVRPRAGFRVDKRLYRHPHSTTETSRLHTHNGYAKDSQRSCYARAAAAQSQLAARRLAGMMAWEVVRRDQLELIAPSCSLHVNSSIEPHVISGYRHKDRRRWRSLERSPALGRHGQHRRDLVARARHSHGEHTCSTRASRSCRRDTSAAVRSAGQGASSSKDEPTTALTRC